MATAQPSCRAAATHQVRRGVQPLRAGEGHSFLWRKLHSLSGIVPIGAFLVEHIVSNFEALNGPARLRRSRSSSSTPCRWSASSSGPSSSSPSSTTASTASTSGCAASRTSMSTPGPATGCMSRSAGPASSPSLYIVQHVWRQRFMGVSLPEHPGAAFQGPARTLQSLMLAIYVIAMIAICWHFAYGVWLFAAKWGITPGDRAASASARSAPPAASSSASWASPASTPSSAPSIRTRRRIVPGIHR